MKQWLASLLSTDNGVSSKRVVTLTAALLLFLCFILNMFWAIKVDEYIYNGMLYLAAAGLGTTALERFAFGKTPPSPPSEDKV